MYVCIWPNPEIENPRRGPFFKNTQKTLVCKAGLFHFVRFPFTCNDFRIAFFACCVLLIFARNSHNFPSITRSCWILEMSF